MDEQESFDIPALRAELLAHLGSHADVYPVHLEQGFPRILAKIVALWGKPSLEDFLSGLMVSDRPGRQGFPPDVAMEIFRLSMLHGTLGFFCISQPRTRRRSTASRPGEPNPLP